MSATLSFLRYSLRSLLKSPGFTITAIIILGSSIGLSTAIFSLIDAVILKPLPFPNSERLVEVCQPYQHHPFNVFDYPDYFDMAATEHTFDCLALKVERTVDLRTNGEAQLLEAAFVSPSLFRVTGLPVTLGRVFTDKEDIPNGPSVAVLSVRCWRSRFQSDPNIIGKNVILSDLSLQVVCHRKWTIGVRRVSMFTCPFTRSLLSTSSRAVYSRPEAIIFSRASAG